MEDAKKISKVTANNSVRIDYFDFVRALMMLWVIWGHVGGYGLVRDTASIYMVNAKIGVNMPMFFIISGYFAALSFSRCVPTRIIARAICFLWPQIVFAMICAFTLLVATQDISIFWKAFTKVMNFWFLRTLAVIYLLCAAIFHYAKASKSRWICFCAVYLIMIFWPEKLSFCKNTIHMFPYFVFGLMVLSNHKVHEDKRVAFLCGFFFIFLVFFQGNSNTNGMNFWFSNTYWRSLFSERRAFVTFFARTAVGILGSIFLLCIAKFMSNRFGFLMRVVGALGTTTLGVYVIHQFPLLLLSKMGGGLPSWSRWPIAVFYFLLCHYIVLLIKRFKSSDIFFFGSKEMLVNFLDRIKSFQVIALKRKR